MTRYMLMFHPRNLRSTDHEPTTRSRRAPLPLPGSGSTVRAAKHLIAIRRLETLGAARARRQRAPLGSLASAIGSLPAAPTRAVRSARCRGIKRRATVGTGAAIHNALGRYTL